MSESVEFLPEDCQWDETPIDDTAFGGQEIAGGYHRLFQRMCQAQAEVTGDPESRLSAAQEWQLAYRIQLGLVAKTRLAELQGKAPEARLETLEHAAQSGAEARQQLFDANMRFAGYFARASMGIVNPSKYTKDSDDETYSGRRRMIGSYANITKLASQDADIEDRTQVALEAMWKATLKYQPRYDDDGKPKDSKFVTFVAWAMQGALQRHTIEIEPRGWSITTSVFEKTVGSMEQADKGAKWQVRLLADGGLRISNHPTIALEGRRATTIDTVTGYAPEEADEDGVGGNLSHADVIEDIYGENPITTVADILLREQLDAVLDTLSEREAGVIALRYGMFDGTPKTLEEVGMVYGLTRESARKIESKVLNKLRHPSRSQVLEEYMPLDPAAEPSAEELRTLSWGVPLIDQQYLDGVHSGSNRLEQPERPAPPVPRADLESWQVYENEPWDLPGRSPESYE